MTIPDIPELRAVARRVMWHCTPEQALAQPYHFLAHVMTYASIADVLTVRKALPPEAFCRALEQAPPGIFDNRSWAYWHLMCGCRQAPPLPERSLSDTSRSTTAANPISPSSTPGTNPG